MLSRLAFLLLTVSFLALGGWLLVGATASERPSTAYTGRVLQTQPDAHGLSETSQPALGESSAAIGPAVSGEATALDAASSGATSVPVSTVVDREWLARTAASTGIPERALAAYAAATLKIDTDQPGCGIGWNTLAAIGAVESGHGSHAGSVVGDDGVVRPGIFGPPLDGGDFAHIGDSDGGTLDGDAGIDRAVGPFQFIPQTWEMWGSDGNGDGAADPQNLTDAALSAARYLCSYGDLTSIDGWRAAVFGYNHDGDYVDLVAARATEYGQRGR